MAPITIGNFLGIQTGVSCVVAVITYVDGGDKAAGEQPAHMIPRSESELSVRIDSNRGVDAAFIHSVVERWRGATMGNKRKLGDVAAEAGKPSVEWGPEGG